MDGAVVVAEVTHRFRSVALKGLHEVVDIQSARLEADIAERAVVEAAAAAAATACREAEAEEAARSAAAAEGLDSHDQALIGAAVREQAFEASEAARKAAAVAPAAAAPGATIKSLVASIQGNLPAGVSVAFFRSSSTVCTAVVVDAGAVFVGAPDTVRYFETTGATRLAALTALDALVRKASAGQVAPAAPLPATAAELRACLEMVAAALELRDDKTELLPAVLRTLGR